MRIQLAALLLCLTITVFARKADPCTAFSDLQVELEKEAIDSTMFASFITQKYKQKTFEQEYCLLKIKWKYAWFLFEKGHQTKAIDWFEAEIAPKKDWKTAHPLAYLDITSKLGWLHYNIPQRREALALYDEAISILNEENEEAFVLQDRDSAFGLGAIYAENGIRKQSLHLLQMCARYLSDTDFNWNARVFEYLSLVTPNLQKSYDIMQQSIAELEKIEGVDRMLIIDRRARSVDALWGLGKFSDAYRVLLNCMDDLDNATTVDSATYFGVVGRLANSYLLNEQYEEPLELLHKTVDFWKRDGVQGMTHYCHFALLKGNALIKLKRYEEAEQFLLALGDEIKNYQPIDLVRMRVYDFYLTIITYLYDSMGDYEKAMAYTQEHYEILQSRSLEPTVSHGHLHRAMGRSKANLKQYDGALEDYTKARTIIRESAGATTQYFSALARMIDIYVEAYPDKHSAMEEIIVDMDSLYFDYLNNDFLRLSEEDQLAAYAAQESNQKRIQLAVRQAVSSKKARIVGFDQSMMMKNVILESRKRQLALKKKISGSKLQEDYQEWQDLWAYMTKQLSLPVAKRAPDFDTQKERFEFLERFLAAEVGQQFAATASQTRYADIQAALPENTAYIEFNSYYDITDSLGNTLDQYTAYIVRKNQDAPVFIPLFRDNELPPLKNTRTVYAYKEQGQNWYLALIKPLLPHLEGIENLYFSPSGVLNRLNLGALPYDATSIMSEHFTINPIGNGRDLIVANEIAYQTTDAVLFGGIDYELEQQSIEKDNNSTVIASIFDFETATRGARNSTWQSLPFSEVEVNQIHQLLSQEQYTTTVYQGKAASEEQFKTLGINAPSPRILHVATHGYFFADDTKTDNRGFQTATHPLIRSGIILAGANHVWAGNAPLEGKEDGILTAYEISQMDLSNTELVVLSACETGLGDIEGNEGVYGLQRAFKMAGVKYVMMSLWSVRDQQTQEFMTLFYEEWLENKKEIPQAYQAAQNAMKVKYAKPFNPNLWAGFVLVE